MGRIKCLFDNLSFKKYVSFQINCAVFSRGQKWFPMMLDYVKVKTVECLPVVMESKHEILVRVKVRVLKYLITFSQF